ncbi:unnamed protein product [Closterium sp. NIES-54]
MGRRAVAAAPPPLASAVAAPVPGATPVALDVAPPMPFPAAATAAPAAAVTLPLLSPNASATAPAATVVTPPLLSIAVTVTPPLLSPSKAGPPNVPPCPARKMFLPCSPRAALPCSPRATLPCSPRSPLQPALAPVARARPWYDSILSPRSPLRPTLAPAAALAPSAHASPCSRARPCSLRSPLQPHSPLQPARFPALQPARLCCPVHCVRPAIRVRPAAHADLPPVLTYHPRACARLGVDNNIHCLTRTLYHRSSFASGLFSEAALVVELGISCVLEVLDSSSSSVSHSVGVAALGASESAAALGASEIAATGASESASSASAASTEALHTFTLDFGASRCFFSDCTTFTPLIALVPVSLADPSGGPVVARASTFLPCPAVPSSSLSSLHLPSFSRILVSYAVLQNVWVDTFIPGGQRVVICTSLGPLPRSPAPPCLPCVEGQQRAAPHSSSFPPTTGTDQERYFLLVVDDYMRYTAVFPLRSKMDFRGVLIPWIHATRRQLREQFRWDLPFLRLHSDKGSEFSSSLLAEFCRDEGIV